MNSNPILCQRCNQAHATVHVKQRVNGKESSRHLCAACAAKEGLTGSVFSSSLWEGDPFENLLGSFFLPNRSGGVSRCATCGQSLADVKRTGRFGCSDCYTAFEHRVDLSPFTSPQGYKGKRPALQAQPTPPAPPKEEAPSREQETLRLKQELKKAVEQEEYEKAAKLRDQLRALEGKEGK